MKSFIVLALFVAAAAALPVDEKNAEVVRSFVDNIGVGPFSYESETSNGIKQQAEGRLEDAGTENEAIAVRGQFSYVGTDGLTYTVTYIADRNGFQPQGAHLPVAQ